MGAFVLLSVLVCSCDADYLVTGVTPKYVVEGWIDSGANPVVLLTKSIPIDTVRHSEDDIAKNIVYDADVRVVADGDTIPLLPKIDPDYFPPFIYTTEELTGICGHRYDLLIDTSDGQHLTATTTIPDDVPVIDTLYAEQITTCDTLYQLTMRFRHDLKEKNYYKVFTRVNNDRFSENEHGYYASFYHNSFLSPIISCLDDAILGKETTFSFTRGFMNYVQDANIYFMRGDKIIVKFAKIDSESYRFWEEQQNQMLFGTNYMFHGTRDNVSTINGGLGSWCGYAAIFYDISIPYTGE